MKNKTPDFLKFYQNYFPSEELDALLDKNYRCVRVRSSLNDSDQALIQNLKPYPWYKDAYFLPEEFLGKFDPESKDYYLMDPASMIPVLLLNPQAGDKIADLCAAPGGKSAFIWDLLARDGELLACDLSESRFQRMKKNFARLGIDGDRLKFFCGSPRKINLDFYFDKILLDVPCSSEFHVWHDPQELKKWSPTRSLLLAKRQRKIFAQALRLAKKGARIVYSTCSISPLENEENVAFFLKKWRGQIEVEALKIPGLNWIEKKYGAALYPNQQQMGPMYFCVFRKN